MKKGVLYNGLDCLDVLETLEDKTYSLIYLNIDSAIGKRSKRIMYDESRENPVAALRRERGCKLQDLSNDEIRVFIEECENDRKREYEKYLFKVIQNCCRVLTDSGVVIYREIQGEPDYIDLKYILDNLFFKFGKRVLEHVGMSSNFDLLHFYSKNREFKFPAMYELQPLERYPYEDEKGQYRLLPLDCGKNETNYFEWNGYFPLNGKGWRYSKEMLDDLDEKGYIVPIENVFGNFFPKLKYYREEHPVPVSAIWSDRNMWERIFDLFTSKEDRVLGVYESLGFACSAEKKNLTWCSVYPRDVIRAWTVFNGKMEEVKIGSFRGKGQIEGKYKLIESLQNHKPRTYNENIPSIVEQLKERKEFFRDVVKEYELNERPSLEVGDTIDKALLHYIDEYMIREGIGPSEFERRSNVTRTSYYEMQDVVNGKRKPKDRKKETIIKIAVHTRMGYPETIRTLALAGKSFEDNNVVDDAIIAWMYNENRTLDELERMITRNCENANWSKTKIDNCIDKLSLQIKTEENEEKKERISPLSR